MKNNIGKICKINGCNNVINEDTSYSGMVDNAKGEKYRYFSPRCKTCINELYRKEGQKNKENKDKYLPDKIMEELKLGSIIDLVKHTNVSRKTIWTYMNDHTRLPKMWKLYYSLLVEIREIKSTEYLRKEIEIQKLDAQIESKNNEIAELKAKLLREVTKNTFYK